jgi:type I restriction enzyme, R subunit
VIHKLRTNKPLTAEDIMVLENILWGEVGTQDDYMHEYGEKPLSLLVREITGLDQIAANEAFSMFLSDNDMTYEQAVFVKTIVDFVVRNGVLELKNLQEEPFRSVGSILQFPMDKGQKLVEVIKSINYNAGLA